MIQANNFVLLRHDMCSEDNCDFICLRRVYSAPFWLSQGFQRWSVLLAAPASSFLFPICPQLHLKPSMRNHELLLVFHVFVHRFREYKPHLDLLLGLALLDLDFGCVGGNLRYTVKYRRQTGVSLWRSHATRCGDGDRSRGTLLFAFYI